MWCVWLWFCLGVFCLLVLLLLLFVFLFGWLISLFVAVVLNFQIANPQSRSLASREDGKSQ